MSISNNVQQEIIAILLKRIVSKLDSFSTSLMNGDSETACFVLKTVETFIFESELAYQNEMPLVGIFLEQVRGLIYQKLFMFSFDKNVQASILSVIESMNRMDGETLDHKAGLSTSAIDLNRLMDGETLDHEAGLSTSAIDLNQLYKTEFTHV